MPETTEQVRQLPAKSEWLRVNVATKGVGVDREKNVINGVILAEEGPFKSEGRGEFDGQAIRAITKMTNAKGGLKSRWTHPGLSADGLGTFLGRFHDAKTDKIMRQAGEDENGKPVYKEVLVTRANLHLDPTSFETPSGNLGKYVMDLAENDQSAFGTSLVLQKEDELRLDDKGRRLQDAEGNDLPPLWRPTKLHGSDIVDEGDATNSFLSSNEVDRLPDAVVRRGTELLDRQFAGQKPEVIQQRCSAWLSRYLSAKFPDWNPSVQKLAVPGELAVGDSVIWMIEDQEGLSAEQEDGTVVAIATDGPLGIPGTTLTLEGIPDDPAVLIRDCDDEDCCWYLVQASRLTKMEGEVTDGALAAPSTAEAAKPATDATPDDLLLLELDLRLRG